MAGRERVSGGGDGKIGGAGVGLVGDGHDGRGIFLGDVLNADVVVAAAGAGGEEDGRESGEKGI
jgi:hypothetical protein